MDSTSIAAAPDGAEPRQLGDADVARLTDETVILLLDKQDLKTEVEIWVRRGRIVRKYVRTLQPGGKFTKPDPYGLLAEHPDVRWSANQLRAFVDALELWEQIGEGAPSLPMSFYALVASSILGFEAKKALLTKAVEQHLSTRDVKGELAEAKGDADEGDQDGQDQEGSSGTPAAKTTGDWKRVEAYAEKLNAELSAIDLSGMASLEVISKLVEVAERITALVASLNKAAPK